MGEELPDGADDQGNHEGVETGNSRTGSHCAALPACLALHCSSLVLLTFLQFCSAIQNFIHAATTNTSLKLVFSILSLYSLTLSVSISHIVRPLVFHASRVLETEI